MENLCTAIIPVIDPSNILSEQEFQVLLSSWLEEKGILSNLRSHLRFNMVNALKGTAVGKDINRKTFHRMSLHKQAINTIVAEFLLQNKCYYSLSVFNTEVSLTHILPDFPVGFDNGIMSNGVNYLDKENIIDIMELIGIIKTSVYCEEILTLYKQEHNSLLYCIISLLGKLVNKNDRMCNLHLNANTVDLNVEANFMKQVEHILNLSGLADSALKATMENINILYDIEKNGIEVDYSRLIRELKTEISKQEKQTRDIVKSNKMLKTQLIKITNDYKKLKSHTRNLLLHDKTLRNNCIQENKYNRNVSSSLTNNLNANDLILKSADVTRKENIDACRLKHCNEVCKHNITINGDLVKRNKSLIEENEQQAVQIKELTLKYKQLVDEFTECQQKIDLLNSKLNGDYPEELLINVLYRDITSLPAHLGSRIDASDVSSDNITEEIVHDTRLRLKQLEKETKKIEDKCKLLNLNSMV